MQNILHRHSFHCAKHVCYSKYKLVLCLGLSKENPYLKQALSQKTCFSENACIFMKMHENAHILTENACIFT